MTFDPHQQEATFIISEIAAMAFCEPDDIQESTPLFSSGIIDSVMLLELVVLLEKKYGVKIAPGELILENFDSVSNICKLLARKISNSTLRPRE